MGYYTTYDLVLRTPDGKQDIRDQSIHDKAVELLRERDVIGYALDTSLSCNSAVKWYDHDEDMIAVSKQMPNVLFCLHGEGDETGDIWDAYYLNGKSQYCRAEVVIPPFDPDKLE